MPANSFTTALVADNFCNRNPATVAYSALMVLSLVHPFRRARRPHAIQADSRDKARRLPARLVTGHEPAVRSALMGRGRIRSGLAETWGRKLTPSEDFTWRTVLERFASDGRPASVQEIAERIGVPDDEARTLLADLRSHDLLGLDESATTITYAYPFANTPTEHRVQLYRRLVHAMCAIDALGIAGMLGTNTRIESCCRACGGRIEVRTTPNGKALGHYRPAEAFVWYDFAYAQAAAASCCPAIAFFCSNEHLEQWLLAQSRKRVGSRLTLNEGLELARALFEPVLATTSLR